MWGKGGNVRACVGGMCEKRGMGRRKLDKKSREDSGRKGRGGKMDEGN